MKKVLLLLSVLLIGMSVNAAKWAVVGNYTNPGWTFEVSTILEGSGDELTCTIEKLSTGFKIVDIENNNWDTQYGLSLDGQYFPINRVVNLTSEGPKNIIFPFNIVSYSNAILTFNPSKGTLIIEANESTAEKGYPTLQVTGSFCSWTNKTDNGAVLLNENNGVYTELLTLEIMEMWNLNFVMVNGNIQ